MIETQFGPALPTTHCYDRLERHGITVDYVEELIEQADEREGGAHGRVIEKAQRDGVLWKVVLENEEDPDLKHAWDVVTVIPAEVDLEAAENSETFDEVQALNLALYSD